jgi:hypothetical protein
VILAAAVNDAQDRRFVAIVVIDYDEGLHDTNSDVRAQCRTRGTSGRVLSYVTMHCFEARTVAARHRVACDLTELCQDFLNVELRWTGNDKAAISG